MDAIKIEGLNKSYGDFAIRNLNLTLPSGTVMGLVGKNGAGKTTLIKLIMDMIKRDSGKITVLGKDNKDNFTLTKEDIGVVLGENGLPHCMSGRDIDRMMKDIYKNWNTEQFYGYLKRFEVPFDKEYKELSKGMRMKLHIAVALSHKARLLILDEATSGLDPVIRDEILDIFAEFTRDENNSILISSHIVSDLEKICDYIAFLHNGQLLLCEEKDRLREEHRIAFFTKEQYENISSDIIIGKKITTYGVEVLMRKDHIPEGVNTTNVTIEDLFIFMAREDNA
ncbi:MAG: ABC transporter ATP-binding protein [Anaerofustis stercorihominis]|nr:ABC transporter ATP-binding protein [Anaerofustis stercorihominis]